MGEYKLNYIFFLGTWASSWYKREKEEASKQMNVAWDYFKDRLYKQKYSNINIGQINNTQAASIYLVIFKASYSTFIRNLV